ncbi:MAG: hypothetical protein WBA76_06170 [Phormidesmis sp.]
MTVSVNNSIDLKALLYALTQQREPLPQPFQHSLQEAGQALRQNQPEADYQLRERIRTYIPLETAYKSALQELDREYASQQRTKSLDTTFANSVGLDWLFINDVIPAADWVFTAKQIWQLQQRSKTQKSSFWDQADRIFIMVIGGIAIGGAIATLPGAIIGGVSAAIYGWWYVNVYENRSSQPLK